MELIIDDRQDKLNVSEELIEKIKDIIIECLDYEGYDDDYEVSLSFVDNFLYPSAKFAGIDTAARWNWDERPYFSKSGNLRVNLYTLTTN